MTILKLCTIVKSTTAVSNILLIFMYDACKGEIFFNLNILNYEFYLFKKISNSNNIIYHFHDINMKHFAICELYDIIYGGMYMKLCKKVIGNDVLYWL